MILKIVIDGNETILMEGNYPPNECQADTLDMLRDNNFIKAKSVNMTVSYEGVNFITIRHGTDEEDLIDMDDNYIFIVLFQKGGEQYYNLNEYTSFELEESAVDLSNSDIYTIHEYLESLCLRYGEDKDVILLVETKKQDVKNFYGEIKGLDVFAIYDNKTR